MAALVENSSTRRAPVGGRLGRLALSAGLASVLLELAVRAFVTVRNVGPSFTVHDPLYGKVLKRSYTCERITPEFVMRFTTNSLGYRGPEPAAFPRGGVVFLGDSFTLGYGVDDGEEFPARIAAAEPIPVVNAGMGNSGNGRWIRFLETDAPALEPRVVVLQLCSNDIGDNLEEGRFRLDATGKLLRVEAVEDPTWRRTVQRLVEAVPGLAYSHVVSMLREERRSVEDADTRADPAAPDGPMALTLALLREALSLCAARGWPALVVAADLEDPLAGEVARLCAELRVPLVELPAKAERPDLYYRIDGHWNASGHEHAANAILEALREMPALSDRGDAGD